METPGRRLRVRPNSEDARRRFAVGIAEQEAYPLMFPAPPLIQASVDTELA